MKAILACTPDGGIGYKNGLPWKYLQGDLARFKKLTDGGVVVMGRNTWESLPKKPLPNRLNLIITTGTIDVPKESPNILHTNNIDLLKFPLFKDAWLIGGSRLINTCWHLIDEVHLSRTYSKYTCDTFIDVVQLETDYALTSMLHNEDHVYEIWKRL